MSHKQNLLFTFQVITDTHVKNQPDHIHNRHLDQALRDLSQFCEQSVGIMHIGDVTDGGLLSEYAEMQRIWNQHQHALPPIRYTVGNHDVGAVVWEEPPTLLLGMSEEELRTVLEEGEPSLEKNVDQNLDQSVEQAQPLTISELWQHRVKHFEVATGMNSPYHDHWISGYHFIFLGTEQPHPKDCQLSDEQLQWLECKLSEQATPTKPIFIFLHQPLKNTVAGSMEEQGWYGVIQDEALRQVLLKYPQAILFSGHTHWQLESKETMYDGAGHMPAMFNAASVAYLWTDEDKHLEGSQGLQVEVYEKCVVVRGRDFVKKSWIEAAEYRINYPL